MRRFLGYYRQFEELSPEEVSRELRERRDEEKRAGARPRRRRWTSPRAAWHEPPHAEIVNAATFALRRAVNAYPDAGAAALRAALAARHGVEPAQVVAGHGAGELLRAALQALLAARRRRGRDRVAGLGAAAAARARGRRRARAGAARPRRRRRRRRAGGRGRGRARARSRCARPTTRPAGRSTRPRCAASRRALPAGAWILLDAALADFEEPRRGPRRARRRARAPARRALVLQGARDGGLPGRLRGRAGRRARAARAARAARSASPRPPRPG